MMEKRKLADLPNELGTQILSNIHGQSHLAMIALLSKQFGAIVDLLIYRHISLDIHYLAKDLDAPRANDVTDIRRLADNKTSCVPQLNRVTWWYH